ncbi:MAG: hypothetical protein U0521_11035 [Anaerolineae bacterium]
MAAEASCRGSARRDVEAEGVQLSNRILRRAREVGEFRRERVFGADQVPGSIRPLAVKVARIAC